MQIVPPTAKPQDGIFALSTPRHMLAKLGWELGQFRHFIDGRSGHGDAITSAGYQAFNCAVTAWHCADWAWAYADDEGKKHIAGWFELDLQQSDRANREAFFDAVCAESSDVETCRRIADSAKHLKLNRQYDRGFQTTVRCRSVPGAREGGFELVLGLLADDGKGKPPAIVEQVLEGAHDYWRHLYEDLGYVDATCADSSHG